MTLVIKILSMYLQSLHHPCCVSEPKSSLTLRYSTDLESALE